MKSGKRIQWLDFAKGFAILGVVMGHIINNDMFNYGVGDNSDFLIYLQFILFIFVMPSFFVISGYLYKPTKTLHSYLLLLYKKTTSIFLPYVFFSFFVLFINDFHEMRKFHEFLNFHQFLLNYVYSPNGYLWFLYALFVIFIIIGFFDLIKLNNFWQFVFCLLLLYLQLKYSWTVGEIDPQCGICSFIIFFWIGKILKQYDFIYKYLRKYLYFILIMSVISSCLMIYAYKFYNISLINTDSNNITFLDFIPKLLSVPLLFWFSRIIEKYNIFSFFFRYFDKYGKCTLIIYLVHYWPAKIIGHILSRMSFNPIFNFVILFVITWYICIAVWYLSTKINIINFVFYPRRYINKVVLKTTWGKRLLEK